MVFRVSFSSVSWILNCPSEDHAGGELPGPKDRRPGQSGYHSRLIGKLPSSPKDLPHRTKDFTGGVADLPRDRRPKQFEGELMFLCPNLSPPAYTGTESAASIGGNKDVLRVGRLASTLTVACPPGEEGPPARSLRLL